MQQPYQGGAKAGVQDSLRKGGEKGSCMHSAGPIGWYKHETWDEEDLLGLGEGAAPL